MSNFYRNDNANNSNETIIISNDTENGGYEHDYNYNEKENFDDMNEFTQNIDNNTRKTEKDQVNQVGQNYQNDQNDQDSLMESDHEDYKGLNGLYLKNLNGILDHIEKPRTDTSKESKKSNEKDINDNTLKRNDSDNSISTIISQNNENPNDSKNQLKITTTTPNETLTNNTQPQLENINKDTEKQVSPSLSIFVTAPLNTLLETMSNSTTSTSNSTISSVASDVGPLDANINGTTNVINNIIPNLNNPPFNFTQNFNNCSFPSKISSSNTWNHFKNINFNNTNNTSIDPPVTAASNTSINTINTSNSNTPLQPRIMKSSLKNSSGNLIVYGKESVTADSYRNSISTTNTNSLADTTSSTMSNNHHLFPYSPSISSNSYTNLKSRSASITSLSSSTTSQKSVRFSDKLVNVKTFRSNDEPAVVAKADIKYAKNKLLGSAGQLSRMISGTSSPSPLNFEVLEKNSNASSSNSNSYLLFDEFDYDDELDDLNELKYRNNGSMKKNGNRNNSDEDEDEDEYEDEYEYEDDDNEDSSYNRSPINQPSNRRYSKFSSNYKNNTSNFATGNSSTFTSNNNNNTKKISNKNNSSTETLKSQRFLSLLNEYSDDYDKDENTYSTKKNTTNTLNSDKSNNNGYSNGYTEGNYRDIISKKHLINSFNLLSQYDTSHDLANSKGSLSKSCAEEQLKCSSANPLTNVNSKLNSNLNLPNGFDKYTDLENYKTNKNHFSSKNEPLNQKLALSKFRSSIGGNSGNKRRTSNLHQNNKRSSTSLSSLSSASSTSIQKLAEPKIIQEPSTWELSNPNFTNIYSFFGNENAVDHQNVKLQSIQIDKLSGLVKGKLHVLNLHFEKNLTIKYTLDQWTNMHYSQANYVKTVNSKIDEFGFEIDLAKLNETNQAIFTLTTSQTNKKPFVKLDSVPSLSLASKIKNIKLYKMELCCIYNVNDQTYYDNNNYQNYKFEIKEFIQNSKKNQQSREKAKPHTNLNRSWSTNDTTSLSYHLKNSNVSNSKASPEGSPSKRSNLVHPRISSILDDSSMVTSNKNDDSSSQVKNQRPGLTQRSFSNDTEYFNNNPMKHLYHKTNVSTSETNLPSLEAGTTLFNVKNQELLNYKLENMSRSPSPSPSQSDSTPKMFTNNLNYGDLSGINMSTIGCAKSDVALNLQNPLLSVENNHRPPSAPLLGSALKYDNILDASSSKKDLEIDEALLTQIGASSSKKATFTMSDTSQDPKISEKGNNSHSTDKKQTNYNDLLERFCFFVPDSPSAPSTPLGSRTEIRNMSYE
ncbi:hypothetical protein ACO0RG_003353 [Hanseniaspora osmophila]